MNTRRRLFMSVTFALIVAFALPLTAFAHPLGNFTINRYSRLELGRDSIRVRYVVDMAEIPTFQERPQVDTNGDDVIDTAEHKRYLSDQIATLQSNLRLIVNGKAVALQAQESQLEFVPGQGGLLTTRISAWFVAGLSPDAARVLEYRDENFQGRLGWQEIVVRPDGINLAESSVPTQDLSDELRSYPQDLLQSPPAVSSAKLKFELTGTGSPTVFSSIGVTRGMQSLPGRTTDRFAELIAIPDLGLGAILAALLGAFVWGAAHAFSPGHGKTIVAAYLVGSRATARHALFLGATTTVTHTAGVFTLGLITLFASRYIVPEQLYPWLEVGSGALLVVLGISMFAGRVRRVAAHDHARHAHDHDYDHDHFRMIMITIIMRVTITAICRRARMIRQSRGAACWRWAFPADCCRAHRRWW